MNLKTSLAFLCCLFVLAKQCGAVDWCNMQGCTANRHIACNHNSQFDASCSAPRAVVLSAAQKELLLSAHNTHRNTVAAGRLSGFLPAKRMAKLTWNDEMAWLAELNTKQCRMAHDACRNTPSFRYSGQNLAMMMTTGTYTTESVINGAISMWFNEYKDARMSDIDSYSSTSSSGKTIGHFTAMVTDRSTQIGCAISSFRTTSGSTVFNAYLLACNYASTNILSCPVYKSGAAASACTSGADGAFPALCKISEPINPNNLC